ncbi:hypothetical protein N7466_007267 [Penicillium verhagenii]|uniref:uncharacterized protein n=1 Tax=Penicillium verhagenii TaxID=1562060 RepID=UPI00254550AB|nr:uncharacterized protein N7466_007267 [Penicillium verhagenii]KAJ5928311.1 hypothetical protein N7466_007267 [Penicillium verhagenii]
MFSQNLVCDRCWSTFFNTEAFEKVCTLDRSQGDYGYPNVEAVATVLEIREAVCNWCAYMREFVNDSWVTEDQVTMSISPTFIASFVPAGKNLFYLSIDCKSPHGKWKGGYSLFIYACTPAEDPGSAYVTARPLRTDVDSEMARTQMQLWLEECKKHKICSIPREKTFLPSRLIEVSPQGQQQPRIVECTTDMYGVYATLSYCSGKKAFTTLSKSNYAQFALALEVETLPPTFRDAIEITRTLSIPYLWIDALCIFQDDEEEKVRHTGKMKELLSSSALTIIAASSEDVYQGFIHPRAHQEILHTIPFRMGPDNFGSMSINELNAACSEEWNEPIAKRAWPLQEQILSNRTLVFTTKTMTWKCHDGAQNFGNSLYFPHYLGNGFNDNDEKESLNLHSLLLNEHEAGNSQDKALSCWLRIVTEYSLRATSLERDRLNALAGVASHLSFFAALGPGYFAGLWQHELARQLTWYTSDWHKSLGEDESLNIRRPIKYRAPSWSWASLDGGVVHFDCYYDDEDEESPDVICEIMDCSTKATFPKLNPLGEILSAELTLKGPIRRAWFNPATSNIFILPGPITSMAAALTVDDCPITFEEASQKHAKDFGDAGIDPEIVAEDPEATYLHGTYFRNMLGRSDETVLCEPCLVLCLGITMKGDSDDGVTGLILVNSEDSSDNDQLKRIGSFERGRNHDFENEAKSQVVIV